MKSYLKDPAIWLFVIMSGWYIGVPASFLIADKAEERVVLLNDQRRSVFIEWDAKRVRLPAGLTPAVLFEEKGTIRKNTYLPPSRFAPWLIVISNDATPQEIILYRQLFPIS